jgi:acyl-CoA dehydrogenase
MDFKRSEAQELWLGRLTKFMSDVVEPAIPIYEEEFKAKGRSRFAPSQVLEELKLRARKEGLWNLFMTRCPEDEQAESSFQFESPFLSNLDYAPLAEAMAWPMFASEVFNCSAPDTGNMEVLHRYGTAEQKEIWLRPLMNGDIRSAFLMTEPEVASSDATNIRTSIRRDGDSYLINGRKWWSSGVGDQRTKFAIVMGKTDAEAENHKQQSQIIVPLDAPGVEIVRLLDVFGFDDAPHGHAEVLLNDVRVPAENLILGEGRGFEIAQGRLGPGRIHHCMRTIGHAERALGLMVDRLRQRSAFGKRIIDHSVWEQRIAEARIEIEMCRLLCLKAADMMDRSGNKDARGEIAMIKVAAPRVALKVMDDAIQAFGGAGVLPETGLAHPYALTRALRIADGPDEVHCRTIARLEMKRRISPH